MGKPNPVLQIKVAERWLKHPAIRKLHDIGHQIIPLAEDDCDLILHPAAHGWHEALFEEAEDKQGNRTGRYPYVDTALVAARKHRRERKK